MNKQQAGSIIVLAKLGPKLLSLFAKMGKFLSLGKVGLAAASVASYTILFTWQFALVIVGSVFFHEVGHTIGMMIRGVKVKGVYMIPFLGGAAVAEGSFKTRTNESFIALAGPIFGLFLALAVYVYVVFSAIL